MARGDLTPSQAARVHHAVAAAEGATGLQLCVVLCQPQGDPRRQAERVFAQMGLRTRPAVLLAVVPDTHRIEIVTSPAAAGRVSDDDCRAAVAALATAVKASEDLADGVEAALGVITGAAGRGRADGTNVPNVLHA